MCDADDEVSTTYRYSKSAGATISMCVCEKTSGSYSFRAVSGSGDCT
jgi:hypothetical protein